MEYNNLLNAEIILPNGDDTQQIINIIDRKQVLYGKFIGRWNEKPILDRRE